MTYKGGTYGLHERDTYLEVPSLQSGFYYLMVEMEWNQATPRGLNCEVVVTSYGPPGLTFAGDESTSYYLEDVL